MFNFIQKSILICLVIFANICINSYSLAMVDELEDKMQNVNLQLKKFKAVHPNSDSLYDNMDNKAFDSDWCEYCKKQNRRGCKTDLNNLLVSRDNIFKRIERAKEERKEEEKRKEIEKQNVSKVSDVGAKLLALQLEEAELRVQLLKEQINKTKGDTEKKN